MNMILFLQGLIEISISIITGLFIFFMSFKLFTLLTREVDELQEIKGNNVAVGILSGSFVFGVMLLVRAAIGPAMDTLSTVMNALGSAVKPADADAGIVVYAIIRIVVFYIVSAILAFIVLWLAIKLFMLMTTDIDEMEEIKNQNVSIAVVLATLIISMSIILSNPLATLLNGLVAPPVPPDQTTKMTFVNMPVFIEGLIELGIAIVAVIFIFFLSFRIFSILTKKIDEVLELKSNNFAMAILCSAFIFGMMILVKSAIEPANQALGFALDRGNAGILSIIGTTGRIALFFIIAAAIGFVVLWLAMKTFMFLTTKLNEMEEIKNKNVAVAVVIAILIIAMALVLEHGLAQMLSGLIETPELGRDAIPSLPVK